jgi:prepilin-type N-terminal cleavage/methylation domain-containing protein
VIVRLPTRRAFTLIEIMIVIAIIMMVITTGIPLVTRVLNRDPLAAAVNDTLEGCKLARDRAILQNRPYEFVIRNRGENDAEFAVEPAKIKAAGPTTASSTTSSSSTASTISGASGETPAPAGSTKEVGSLVGDFPRKLGKDVAIDFLFVNFIDLMDASEARVRFYPNGTSDEFSVSYSYQGKRRTIKVDIVTGAAWEVKE